MPRPSWGWQKSPLRQLRPVTKRFGRGAVARRLGPVGWGRPPIRGAPSGTGPSGAGKMAAGHPTPGEQATVAAWCPMELLIEVTPDILLWVGLREGRQEWGEPCSELV